jgi:hypothetical protein
MSERPDRFELRWPGKGEPVPRGPILPLRTLERFPDAAGVTANHLVSGDNLAALPELLARARGTARVLYLDPPFVTGDAFRVRRRTGRPGDPDDGGAAFADRSRGGIGAFLAMLAPRLALARDLLAPDGSLYLHLDARTVHAAKLLCDEIFGARRFRNHLVWVYSGRERARTRYAAKHDDILYYARSARPLFRPARALEPLLETSRRAMTRHVDADGRAYVIRRRAGGGFTSAEEEGATYRQFVPNGIVPRDWFALDYARKSERTGYPTQKPEALLARLLAVSSDPGDLVVDLFAGSGTTPVVAASMDRRWIGVDASPAAIAVSRARLLRSPSGGGFDVCSIEDPAPTAELTLTARVTVASGRAELQDPAEEIDAWAVGVARGDGSFVALPGAWAARDPWTRRLPTSMALPGELPPGAIVRAWDATGTTATLPIGGATHP